MKTRPMIFNSLMVRGLLDNSKTQIWKPFKPIKNPGNGGTLGAHKLAGEQQELINRACPFGQPGDQIWVRETFQGPLFAGPIEPPDSESPEYCRYAADGGGSPEFQDMNGQLHHGWRSSGSMPRWASRITLKIVAVRLKRFQDCSTAHAAIGSCQYPLIVSTDPNLKQNLYIDSADLINNHNWFFNPWVWVIEFKKVAA